DITRLSAIALTGGRLQAAACGVVVFRLTCNCRANLGLKRANQVSRVPSIRYNDGRRRGTAMTTIETTADVGADQLLRLELPVAATGHYRVVVKLEQQLDAAAKAELIRNAHPSWPR